MRRPPRALVLALVALAVATGSAGAGTLQRPPGSPDLAAMALAVSDLPAGTRIESQRYYRDPDYAASYEREFELRSELGRSIALYLLENLDVARTVGEARSDFELLARLFRGKQGRAILRATLAEGGIDPKSVAFGKFRRVALGDGGFLVPMRLTAEGIPFELAFVVFRVDRVLGTVMPLGLNIYAQDAIRISRIAATKTKAGLVPQSKAAPTVSGTLALGQPLTASQGIWTGDQLAFTYQWERCDASGAGCAAVPGATSSTYSAATGDLASTLQVRVTAQNRLGTVSTASAPTAIVSGPAGSPMSAALPLVSGSSQVGATLTASEGTWTGAPTALAYQWRRCDAAGGACVDIAGATSSTYVVSSADSRGTLRVLVVASNAAGPGGAISAATAAVP